MMQAESDLVDVLNRPDTRRAGVCMHLTSLPGPHGIGEIGAAAQRFIDALADMQIGVWQFLPLGPTAFGDSPYQPLSTFAGNEMLIDVGELVELGLLDGGELAPLTALRHDAVEYGQLIPLKNALLRVAASRFATRAGASIRDAFDRFLLCNDSAWLHDYALYRALKSHHDERPWPDWEPMFAHRDAAAIAAFEATAKTDIRAVKIVQFLFFRQWNVLHDYARSRDIALFGDMPIYIALDSSDAWANRKLLRLDDSGHPVAVAGVPPDYFSADGQLWGNPLYDWPQHASDDFRWWTRRLQAASELADLVRIDHFRGFESYWSVAAGATTAQDGNWEPGPGSALFDAMHAALGRLPIVAEDLGVITPAVEDLRDRHGFPGMRVLQFAVCDPGFSLEQIDVNRVCYTGTHDNDTTLGWFHGGSNDTRSEADIHNTRAAALALTGGRPETIHTDLIRAAFSTRARLAIAPMQDFLGLGSEARTNTPGTADGNWRWRLQDNLLTDRRKAEVAAMVGEAGRAPGER